MLWGLRDCVLDYSEESGTIFVFDIADYVLSAGIYLMVIVYSNVKFNLLFFLFAMYQMVDWE